MRNALRLGAIGVGILATLVACGSDPAGTPTDPNTPEEEPGPDGTEPGTDGGVPVADANRQDAKPDGAITTDGATTDGATSDGATTDSGTKPDGATTETGTPTGTPPTLTSATARISGRWAEDLTVTVTGADPRGRTNEIVLRVLDKDDKPVIALDTDSDGKIDSAEAPRPFDTSAAGQTTFTRTVTLTGLAKEAKTAAKASIAVRDPNGRISNAIVVPIAPMPRKTLAESCDPAVVADRCSEGTSCSDAKVCVAGSAPAITRSAYFDARTSSRMLFGGTDLDQDLSSVHVEFLNAGNQPVTVDLDGDGTAESSSVTIDLSRARFEKSFVVLNDAAKTFATSVPRLGVTPSDAAGRSGPRQIVSLSTRPTRALGVTCDPWGFDACVTNSICAPGVPGAANKCTGIAAHRSSLCTAAQLLDPANGISTVVGVTRGVSAFEPPTGCTTDEAIGRPEAVVRLRLARAATKVVLTTALPETTFDTVLYVASACDGTPPPLSSCDDDADKKITSSLTLRNLAAGDYFVIVDGVQPEGGSFGLTVSVE